LQQKQRREQVSRTPPLPGLHFIWLGTRQRPWSRNHQPYLPARSTLASASAHTPSSATPFIVHSWDLLPRSAAHLSNGASDFLPPPYQPSRFPCVGPCDGHELSTCAGSRRDDVENVSTQVPVLRSARISCFEASRVIRRVTCLLSLIVTLRVVRTNNRTGASDSHGGRDYSWTDRKPYIAGWHQLDFMFSTH
jgi:hypothetical protein